MASKEEDILHSGKRDRMEIMAAIIAMTQEPSKITRIMDQTNLNHPLQKKYIRLMLRLRLIEKCEEAKKACEKGQFFRLQKKV